MKPTLHGINTASLKGPYPSRRAAQYLRDHLLAELSAAKLPPGTPFYSDAELVSLTGLSRETVRRTLEDLQKTGWIDRQIGKGSFVGYGPRPASVPARPLKTNAAPAPGRLVRMAVLAFGLTHRKPDWYSQEVLEGLDVAADEQHLAIELIGSSQWTPSSTAAKRLEQSRPDVLLVMPSTIWHATGVADAIRLGIPSLLTGTRLLDLKLPTVCEDGFHGAADAVAYLANQGHRRIGLLQHPDTARLVFERRAGYFHGLKTAGIAPDERLTCWLAQGDDAANREILTGWLDRQKPTALLLSSSRDLRFLGELVAAGRLRIPQDVSLITFDQSRMENLHTLGRRVTTVELPLREIGMTLAKLARKLADGETLPLVTRIPCRLAEGETVRSLPPQ